MRCSRDPVLSPESVDHLQLRKKGERTASTVLGIQTALRLKAIGNRPGPGQRRAARRDFYFVNCAGRLVGRFLLESPVGTHGFNL